MLFPQHLDELLIFEEKEDCITIKPKQFLGSENFAQIAQVVRSNGGEYISAGKDSHFKIAKNQVNRHTGEQQDYEREQAGKAKQATETEQRPLIEDFQDEKGIMWRATKKKDSTEYYWKASVKENASNEAFLNLTEKIDSGDKATIYGDKKFRWIIEFGEYTGDIGMKNQKPKQPRF
jgi:hypothetical protein